MNMHQFALQEFKKLEKQIAHDNRKLEALRQVIKEYQEEFEPSTLNLYELIFECLRIADGHAMYGEIVEFLTLKGVNLPKSKISIALNKLAKDSEIVFNRKINEWQLHPTKQESNAGSK